MKDKIVEVVGDTVLEYEQRGRARQLVGVRRLPQSAADPDLSTLKAFDLVDFNQVAEQAFVRLLAGMCDTAGDAGVSVRVVRSECAFRLGISVETAKRYIEKWCIAPSAPFEIVGGRIRKKEGKEGKDGK